MVGKYDRFFENLGQIVHALSGKEVDVLMLTVLLNIFLVLLLCRLKMSVQNFINQFNHRDLKLSRFRSWMFKSIFPIGVLFKHDLEFLCELIFGCEIHELRGVLAFVGVQVLHDGGDTIKVVGLRYLKHAYSSRAWDGV